MFQIKRIHPKADSGDLRHFDAKIYLVIKHIVKEDRRIQVSFCSNPPFYGYNFFISEGLKTDGWTDFAGAMNTIQNFPMVD
jgi:hypothetical protein